MSDDAIDPAVLESLLESVGGDKEFLKELFDAYAQESTGLLAAIESSVQSGDHEQLRQAAHTLKSTSASLGASRVAELSTALEVAGRNAEMPSAGVVDQLRPLLEAALANMDSLGREQ